LVSEIYGELYKLTDLLLVRTQKHGLVGKTLTVKIKYADFESITRSKTLENGYFQKEEINKTIDYLVENLLPFPKGIRLLGLGVANFLNEKTETGKQLNLEF
jgi:DNA polymerase-4